MKLKLKYKTENKKEKYIFSTYWSPKNWMIYHVKIENEIKHFSDLTRIFVAYPNIYHNIA